MSKPLIGKVATIIDEYTIALNIGRANGVEEGMKFAIVTPSIEVKDPDSSKKLGMLDFTKGKVEVTHVYEKFSVAKSFEVVSALIPDVAAMLSSMYTTRLKRLPVEVPSPEIEMKIVVGDKVVQILE